MRILVTGSLAYDTILLFRDRFANHILPDQVHIINVSFPTEEMRREYGGCCGNIAYNLKLLGSRPVPMGTVGRDFDPYRKWMIENGIDPAHVVEIEDTWTAQAFVTTDIDNNQITAFHPGAMAHAHTVEVGDAGDIGLGIVAPNSKEAMIRHSRQFRETGIPFFFDPGQALPLFNGDELIELVSLADYVCANDYECQMISSKTGLSLTRIREKTGVLIVTHGGGGSDIYVEDRHIHIDTVKVSRIVDPTGCGDAYRSGLLYALANGLDWETGGQLGSLMGGIKIEHSGTQNHRPTRTEIETRFSENFSKSISLSPD
ncbi:MAG: carbohydrate kinase family protein [Gammaproteobacteria bacterium]|nr:carbohydrate kinase family protein [Gammaproteobacteria bacterium]MYJ52522.1 carbohydrate kinase family protein [Gammaproteobacteria bacterium]